MLIITMPDVIPETDSDETVSPKVGLIYDLTDQASLYAVYSETFQQIAGDQYAILKDWVKDVDPITFTKN